LHRSVVNDVDILCDESDEGWWKLQFFLVFIWWMSEFTLNLFLLLPQIREVIAIEKAVFLDS